MAIYKFLIELKITLYLTAPQIDHLILFINSMVTKGYCGKITDVSDFMTVRHRTNEHEIRKINFIGSDCNKNRLYWLSTHIALLSGLFQAQKEKSETIEEFPLLSNGNHGYIWGNNKARANDLFNGLYGECEVNPNSDWMIVYNFSIIEKCQEFHPRDSKIHEVSTLLTLTPEKFPALNRLYEATGFKLVGNRYTWEKVKE
ncbi:hypothetical protein [Clostridium tagluense]|uniref:hypothetical protein n=1 Tax=Clostridium tagluense TaxID=360422 RepID=UPI001A9C0741|nr:hypothetical protein [Clostridium tagluense]